MAKLFGFLTGTDKNKETKNDKSLVLTLLSQTKEQREHDQQKDHERNLVALAKSYIPQIQAEQLEKLKLITTNYNDYLNNWGFDCERFGDYLALRIQSGKSKLLIAVHVGEGQTISYVAGKIPDLSRSEPVYKNESFQEQVVYIDGKYYYPDKIDTTQRGSSYFMYAVLNDPDTGLPFTVDNMANTATCALIIFGDGGNTQHVNSVNVDTNYVIGGNIIYYAQTPTATKKPGYTLYVPAELSEQVYNQILEALKPKKGGRTLKFKPAQVEPNAKEV